MNGPWKTWPFSKSNRAAKFKAVAARPPATDAHIARVREGASKKVGRRLHAVRAAIQSGDGQWHRRWPAPIPVPATIAAQQRQPECSAAMRRQVPPAFDLTRPPRR